MINNQSIQNFCNEFIKSPLIPTEEDFSPIEEFKGVFLQHDNFSIGGFYISKNQDKTFDLSVEVSSGYSYWNPPESDIVKLDTGKDLLDCLQKIVIYLQKQAMDNFLEAEFFANQAQEMEDGENRA